MEQILADMNTDKAFEFLSVYTMACTLPLVQHRLLRAEHDRTTNGNQ